MNAFVRPARKWSRFEVAQREVECGGPMALRRNPLSDLVCRPHCSAHLRVRSMSRRARARRSADIPDPPVSTYTKHTWGWEIVRVLRDAQRAGNRAGMTEADILLAIANNDNARKDIRKGQTPGMLKTVRDHLTTNKFGVFEKCGELAPDLKPKQALWTLKKNADTKNIPEATVGPFQDYAAVWLEKWMLSNASARFLEDPPVAKKPVRVEDDDDDDEGVAPADVDMATEGAPSPPRAHAEPADEDMVDDGDAPPTRGEKRARGMSRSSERGQKSARGESQHGSGRPASASSDAAAPPLGARLSSV